MVAGLQFVAWSRRGIGAAPVVTTVGSRRLVTTSVTVTADRQAPGVPATQPVESAPMAILGPGDVIGVSIDQIVRRAPRPDTHNLEPNHLVAIEFAHPDLPWLFSPVAAVGERLDPWLMLIVVDQSSNQVTARPGSPNPVVVVTDPGALPDPSQAWALAHVQVHGTTADDAKTALRGSDPVAANMRSRVLCPTRLTPDHDYIAALVPTYEAGRLVGIGGEEAGVGTAFWQPDPHGLVLPVYDSWRFRTGPSGDFETLARKLKPVTGQTLQDLGERLVAIEPRAALMQRADAAPNLFTPIVHRVATAIAKDQVPGPLAPGAPQQDAQAAAEASAFHRRLKELVDIVAAATDQSPIVGPPLYGKWSAIVTSLDSDPGAPDLVPPPGGAPRTPAPDMVPQPWIEQLNADPDLRMAAGIATQVVQHDQEPLMTDAWSQLSDVQAANARMRWSRLHASASTVMHERLSTATAASALRTTAPAHGRVLAAPGQTVRAQMDGTTLPREALGSTFARVARYPVRAAARDAAPVSIAAMMTDAVEAMRTSMPAALPGRFTTPRAIDPAQLLQVLATPALAGALGQSLGADPQEYLQRIAAVPVDVRTIANRFEQIDLPPAAVARQSDAGHLQVQIPLDQAQRIDELSAVVGSPPVVRNVMLRPTVHNELVGFPKAAQQTLSVQTLDAINTLAAAGVAQAGAARVDLTSPALHIGISALGTATLNAFAKAAGIADTQALALNASDSLRTATLTNLGVATPMLSDLVGAVTDADTAPLRTGFNAMAGTITPLNAPLAVPPLATFDLNTKNVVVTALEPEAAYGKMLAYAHQNISAAVTRRRDSPFYPLMASPSFPAPLAKRLKVLDPDWVLGGASKLPPNSICLLAVNWRFVEAFLAGANHEMARKLLWRGYPADLRGTCFQQFWPTATPDIRAMDAWSDGDIGDHSDGAARVQDMAIVVIKGDLLQRYPSTLISAERGTASANPGDPQFTTDVPQFPTDKVFGQELFRGTLGQDITYVALDIPISTLRPEIDPANPRHAWYISLLEPHDEPRFGLHELHDGQIPNLEPKGDYTKSDHWSWEGLPDPSVRHLTPDDVFADNSSAIVGASLFLRPFRLLLRAPDYLPGE
jgi:hypothetical protein